MAPPCVLPLLLIVLAPLVLPIDGRSAVKKRSVMGAGATWPDEVYTTWMAAYKASRTRFATVSMEYDARGSSYGKSRIKGSEPPVPHYAGSDSLLTDEEYERHPDVQMFPSLAGPVVLAYNIPGVSDLVLSREQVVGIYNGTIRYWNDSSLQVREFLKLLIAIFETNPDVSLPNERIKVVSRAEKSGTTEILTRALSSFSAEWNRTYGVFNQGLNSSGYPVKWNPDVVTLYGKRIYGVTDEIKDNLWTIGHTSLNLAKRLNLPTATLINKAGYRVQASIQSLRAAMDHFAGDMTERLTSVLVDADDRKAYPIAGYTYFIVRMSEMTNCDSAVELVRYVRWFMETEEQHREAVKMGMVAISPAIARKVTDHVLKKMTCNGENVWRLLEEEIKWEIRELQTWRLPVSIIAPLCGGIIICLAVYLIRQRVLYFRTLSGTEWDIGAEEPTFYPPGGGNKLGSFSVKQGYLVDDNNENNKQDILHIAASRHWLGKWNGHNINLRPMFIRGLPSSSAHMKKDLRRTLTLFKNVHIHDNVLRFYGLTCYQGEHFTVNEFCRKGTLTDVLQDEKFNFNLEFKLSLGIDVATGMSFLHSRGVVHANLKSSTCLINERWVVKIADWEHTKLCSVMLDSRVFRGEKSRSPLPFMEPTDKQKDEMGAFAEAFRNFWTAPEVLNSKFTATPAPSGDVYSFAIVLNEIFSREDPYSEETVEMGAPGVLTAIKAMGLRPQLHRDTPQRVRQVLDISWSNEPQERPSFEQIIKMLKTASPTKKSALDSILETMEEYTQQLESKIEERGKELESMRNEMREMIGPLVPSHVAASLAEAQTYTPETLDHSTVAAMRLSNFSQLSSTVTPDTMVKLFNAINDVIDDVILEQDVDKITSHPGTFMLISGLHHKHERKHVMTLTLATLEICDKCRLLRKPPSHSDVINDFIHTYRAFQEHKDNTQAAAEISENTIVPKLTCCLATGPVSVGVIGSKAPRFMAFGFAADTALSLLPHGDPARLLVSASTGHVLIQDNGFNIALNGEVSIQNGSPVKTYWVSGQTKTSAFNSRNNTNTSTSALSTPILMEEQAQVDC